ncbi:hypothetical protein NQ317_006626 [Molorchus minor]|uniref:Uncharacterized protein n=1 Tax=Molorchus minor TaxID=1323400 RepID=A0ABQ9J0W4_9CUCU|nr:hypothetical protein NQ317_006626 [Molorchus minor]
MTYILRFSKRILSEISVIAHATRCISTSPKLLVKEIKEVQNGKELVIFGEEKASPMEPYLLKNFHPTACPICASGLNIKHTDVLILSQFV